MRKAETTAFLILSTVALGLPVWGEIELQSIRWQTSRLEARAARMRERVSDLDALRAEAGKRLKQRVLARLTVLNRGPAERGLLLRYTVAGKIVPLDGSQPAAWALPLFVEERRVPRVDANTHTDIVLDPTAQVELYLKKVYRAGWWPEEFRLRVQLEPRLGQKLPLRTIESALAVARPGA